MRNISTNLDVQLGVEFFGFVNFGCQDSAKLQFAFFESLGEPSAPYRPHPLPEAFPAMDLKTNLIERRSVNTAKAI
jgi:hypothetical protein